MAKKKAKPKARYLVGYVGCIPCQRTFKTLEDAIANHGLIPFGEKEAVVYELRPVQRFKVKA